MSRYQKKHSPTHTYHGHQPSLICFLHILRSTTSFLINLSRQSFATISLQVFFGLPLGLVPSISYCIHFYAPSLSSFRSTCPYHCNLFCCSTMIMSSNPSPSLNPFFGTLSCSLMPYIHLTILISAYRSRPTTLFSFLTGQVSILCNTLLRTQLLTISPSLSMMCMCVCVCACMCVHVRVRVHVHVRVHVRVRVCVMEMM